MKKLLTAFFLFLTVLGLDYAFYQAHFSPKTFAAGTQRIYWGAYMSGIQYGSAYGTAPWDLSTLNLFQSHTGKKVSIIHFGEPWYNAKSWPNNYVPFPTSLVNIVRAQGSIPMISWGSWDYSYGPNQPDFSLKNIANGASYKYKGQTFDAFVTQWARDAKAWGHPMFLRFDHEMNGWWQFPWETAADPSTHKVINGNTPAQYIAAWRHVHDIFVREGAINVTWVWCPNISDSSTVSLSQLYPGNNYVDWVCLDGYNKDPSSWASFAQVLSGGAINGNHNSYAEITQLAPGKPLMIGEWASNEATGDNGSKKTAWITDALQTQIPKNFPAIQAVMWFNWNSDAGSSFIIESSSAAQNAFKLGIGNPYYAANEFANLNTSPIPPLRTLGGLPTPIPSPKPSPSITPPVTSMVTITSPSNGAQVGTGTTVTILATAPNTTQKVDFLVNGQVVCSPTSSYTYHCAWKVPIITGVTYKLTVRAYDKSGKVTMSAPVVVTSAKLLTTF